MGKEEKENGFDIDVSNTETFTEIEHSANTPLNIKSQVYSDEALSINCLQKKRIVVKFIPKKVGIWGDNPKHVLNGGMAETAVDVYVVPLLSSSGALVNVLTDSEKNFLEEVMGLEKNALSIYNKKDNFWLSDNNIGVNRVRLTKADTYFDLSNPEDYIRYKILLANKNYIAPSLQDLQDHPKATYKYVITSEEDQTILSKANLSTTMQCYKIFGKIESDIDILKMVVETVTGSPVSSNTKLEYLQIKTNDLIQSNSKLVLKILEDPYLNTKILIRKCLESRLIIKRGDGFYLNLKEDKSALCNNGEEPTLNNAAKYLNNVKQQQLKLSLEAQLK